MNIQDEQLNDLPPDILEAALARLSAGEAIDAILADNEAHASTITPLLKTAQLLQTAANEPLPVELSAWLPQGRSAFAQAVQAYQPETSPVLTPAEALDQATEQLIANQPLDTLLADHPEHITTLTPLLRIAQQLHEAATEQLPAELSAWLPKGRRSFATATAAMLASSRRSVRGILRRTFTLQRLVSTALVLVLFFSFAIDQASAQSLPGELLYSWKRTREDLTITLTPTPAGRSALHLAYMQRRLDEIDTLLLNGYAADTPLLDQTANNLLTHARYATDEALQTSDIGLQNSIAQQVSQASMQLSDVADLPPAVNSNLDQISTALGQMGATPTATPIPTIPASPTKPSTATATLTATNSSQQLIPTVGEPAAPTAAPTLSPTARPTRRVVPKPTVAVKENNPPSPTGLPTATSMLPTMTPIPTSTATAAIATRTPTSVPLPTATPSPIIMTPFPTATLVVTAERPTDLPPPTPFPTQRPPRPTATATNTPTATSTATATRTPTNTPTATRTATSVPTNTPTATDTVTATSVPTATDTVTATSVPTATDTATVTSTPTPSNTPLATTTPTSVVDTEETATATPTQTAP